VENIVEPDRPQTTIWRMRISCWIPKATKAHSECVIFIAFPQQQWLHERASMLRYTYIARLVQTKNITFLNYFPSFNNYRYKETSSFTFFLLNFYKIGLILPEFTLPRALASFSYIDFRLI